MTAACAASKALTNTASIVMKVNDFCRGRDHHLGSHWLATPATVLQSWNPSEPCQATPWSASNRLSVHVMSVHVMSVHVISVHVISVHVISVHVM